jgi:D-arabinose 1-dehydrogenase-like Zn-dependent alcohol dehydrogenase
MGADRVVGISRSESKRAEVMKLGADEYIATSDEKGESSIYEIPYRACLILKPS